jgi:REP element-mobilizing transposase RayT
MKQNPSDGRKIRPIDARRRGAMRDFRRKNIRLRPENYIGRGLYFVTLCFFGRRRAGVNPEIARSLIEQLRLKAAELGFAAHAYCVMPDHVHLLVEGKRAESDLMRFIELFKQQTGFELGYVHGRRLWQFKYYDHIVRSHESANRIAWYIWMNPVRKGLCRAPEEYPFAGSFTEIGAAMLGKPVAESWTPPWGKEVS